MSNYLLIYEINDFPEEGGGTAFETFETADDMHHFANMLLTKDNERYSKLRGVILGYANGSGGTERQQASETMGHRRSVESASCDAASMADTKLVQCIERRDANEKRRRKEQAKQAWVGSSKPRASEWWQSEPDVGRVAARIPKRVDRLRGLGNAVVPQVAELIGQWIVNDLA